MYSLGIDLAGGAHAVTWARTPDVDAPTRIDASGSVPAVVGAAPDGTLRVSASGRTPEHEASGFLDRLGSSDPIILGTTPYGAEALVAAVLDEVVRISTTELGDTPAAMGLVHDDWDLFRCSLLVEAARVAGVPPDRVVLVPRAAATTAAAEVGAPQGTPAEAAGGAAVAAATLADERSRQAGVAAAIGAGLAGAVAVSTIGARVLDAGTATAVGAAAGPAGVPISSGPAGAPAAGPAGAPLTGPTGHPLGGGPTGAPLATAAKASRPRWLTAAVAGGTAVVVATVAVVVVATRGDGETAASPPSATAAATTTPTADSAAGPAAGGSTTVAAAPTSTEAATTTTIGTTSTSTPATTLPVFDLAAFAGDWEMMCEPFLAGDGASAGRWSFEVTGGDTMDVLVQGVDYTTTDCSDAGTVLALQQPMTLRIVGIAPVEGVDAFVTVSNVYGIVALAVSGDQLQIGVGGDQPPTSFEPELTAVRR